MRPIKRKNRWRACGESVQGASHIRAGLGNQDAIDWEPKNSRGLPILLAVADGHGSARYFRSATGAVLAVQTALGLLRQFGESLRGKPATVIKRAAESLPRALVDEWVKRVEQHQDQQPFSQDELATLEARANAASVEEVQKRPVLAYGATLVAVYADQASLVYVQLGDGDIVTVSQSGDVSRPLPQDHRLIANETTSLCSPEAWRDVRTAFQPATEEPPALILLSTDGYANSFRTDEGFLQVGRDIQQMLKQYRGDETVRREMRGWLNEASKAGSGDDVTLGLLWRC